MKRKTEPTVDAYLAAVPADMRAALQKLRRAIKKVVPAGTEGISYGIPVMRHRGHPLVGFGAAKGHCTFFLMSTGVMRTCADALSPYEVGKGSIRFPPTKPLPASLVTRLVEARLAENAARGW
jgi:uncharacterized protein YdhG (YjbR/CyaY superfamily)